MGNTERYFADVGFHLQPERAARTPANSVQLVDLDAAVARTVERFGALHVLVNSAGISPRSLPDATYEEAWEATAEVGLVADLDADLKGLIKKWSILTRKLRTLKPPNRVVSELDRTSALLRDVPL